MRAALPVWRALCAAGFILFITSARAGAIPVFANGQGISCEVCHTTFPGMTRYGMMVMMSNFQILDRHLQDQALPISARIYITSLLANKDTRGSTTVSDFSLLGGGFLGRNFTWYTEQHVIDGGSIGQTEQMWISWNGLLHGTNSVQLGKFHTPFPFMPAHAWTIGSYLLATQTTGQNDFNPNDARWGIAFNGMSNEFMYNVSYLTNSGPTGDALNYNRASNPRTLDANVSYGGMSIPWSVGIVAMRGYAPLTKTAPAAFAGTDAFTREGLYLGYQTALWHYQTMYFRGMDSHPDIGAYNVPLRGFFFEAERDLGWRDHILLRYDVASSDSLNRQYVLDLSHNVLPNFALVGQAAVLPGARPQFALQMAYGAPYQVGKRFLANLHAVSASAPESRSQPAPSQVSQTAPTTSSSPGDANTGAKLVQLNGCEGCHGVGLRNGTIGPALYGIEHRRSPDQIASAIANPKAPMPNFGFTASQVADVVAYLSGLDGGPNSAKPVVTIVPQTPIDEAAVSVRFPGSPPQHVSVTPIMQMSSTTMTTRQVTLSPSTSDPHLFTGKVVFSMGGPWTIHVIYDGQTLDVPLTVGS